MPSLDRVRLRCCSPHCGEPAWIVYSVLRHEGSSTGWQAWRIPATELAFAQAGAYQALHAIPSTPCQYPLHQPVGAKGANISSAAAASR